MREMLIALAAALAALALVLAGLALAGYAPLMVMSTAAYGAAGNAHRLAISLEQAMPLMLTGLAAGVALRAGVLNIGGEGQYLIGAAALAGAAAALPASPAALVVGLAAALIAGAAYALVAWALERWRGVPMVLSTILLNVVAVHLLALLVEGPLHDATTSAPQTAPLAAAMTLGNIGGVHLGVWLAAFLVIAAWIRQSATAGGFASAMIGANPTAATLVGLPVARVRVTATAASGALAGLAGAVQTAAVTHQLSLGTSSYGYTGVAVALLGRLHPLGIGAAAIFFGMLDTAASQVERRIGIVHDVGDVAKGVSVCAVLIGVSLAGRAARTRSV